MNAAPSNDLHFRKHQTSRASNPHRLRVMPAPATFFGVLEPEERGHGEIWILVSAKMTEPARVPDDRQLAHERSQGRCLRQPPSTYLKLSRTDPQASVTKMTKHHIFWSHRIRRIDMRCLGFRVADTILRPCWAASRARGGLCSVLTRALL